MTDSKIIDQLAAIHQKKTVLLAARAKINAELETAEKQRQTSINKLKEKKEVKTMTPDMLKEHQHRISMFELISFHINSIKPTPRVHQVSKRGRKKIKNIKTIDDPLWQRALPVDSYDINNPKVKYPNSTDLSHDGCYVFYTCAGDDVIHYYSGD